MRMLLETTMPTIITMPISDMTLSVVPVSNRMISTPVKPGGHRQQDQERIDERLKLRDENQIDQQRREHQAQAESF